MHTFEGILAQRLAHCYRLENSTLPSVSVGTPLHVAGRYLHVRTVCKTRRSPATPALSRISGLCTRPSVPMMKLTLTLRPFAAVVKRGSGVVSASGGSTAAHAGRELICGTSMYCAARRSVFDTCLSRCSGVAECGLLTDTLPPETAGRSINKIPGQMRQPMNPYPRRSSIIQPLAAANLRPQLAILTSFIFNGLRDHHHSFLGLCEITCAPWRFPRARFKGSATFSR